jgi:hypothetical protein
MRDTTQWHKDADRLRRQLLNAYRAGDIDAIIHATQALEILLGRTDRPSAPSIGNTVSHGDSVSMRPRRGRAVALDREASQTLEMSECLAPAASSLLRQ